MELEADAPTTSGDRQPQVTSQCPGRPGLLGGCWEGWGGCPSAGSGREPRALGASPRKDPGTEANLEDKKSV